MYQVGDRVRLLHMDDELDPIEVGSEGTIIGVAIYDIGDSDETQLSVKWDNGRKLMVILPIDRIEVLPRETTGFSE